MSMILVDPRDESRPPVAAAAPRLETLQGKTIVLLDISKPGGAVFLNRLESILGARFGARIVRETKPTFAKLAPQSVIDRILAARPHAVIEALAD